MSWGRGRTRDLTVNGHPREGHCKPRKLLVD
jgi:hypothetical protein